MWITLEEILTGSPAGPGGSLKDELEDNRKLIRS